MASAPFWLVAVPTTWAPAPASAAAIAAVDIAIITLDARVLARRPIIPQQQNILREDDAGSVHVSFMDPESVLGMVNEEGVGPLAQEVKSRLKKVMEQLD